MYFLSRSIYINDTILDDRISRSYKRDCINIKNDTHENSLSENNTTRSENL